MRAFGPSFRLAQISPFCVGIARGIRKPFNTRLAKLTVVSHNDD